MNRKETKDAITLTISLIAMLCSAYATWAIYSSQKSSKPNIEIEIFESRAVKLSADGVQFTHKFRLENTGEKDTAIIAIDALTSELGLPNIEGIKFQTGETIFDRTNKLIQPIVLQPYSSVYLDIFTLSEFSEVDKQLVSKYLNKDKPVLNDIASILRATLYDYHKRTFEKSEETLVSLPLFYWGRNCNNTIQSIIESCISLSVHTRTETFTSRYSASGYEFSIALTL